MPQLRVGQRVSLVEFALQCGFVARLACVDAMGKMTWVFLRVMKAWFRGEQQGSPMRPTMKWFQEQMIVRDGQVTGTRKTGPN